jgi:hypothetical protein
MTDEFDVAVIGAGAGVLDTLGIPSSALEHILLPLPTPGTKGMLVFPTLDGKVVCGPTAIDLQDKRDWPAPDQRRGVPLDRADGLARHCRARGRTRACARSHAR